MLLYQSAFDNLIIERTNNTIEVRYGRQIVDTIVPTYSDYLDTRKARSWVIENVWSGKRA